MKEKFLHAALAAVCITTYVGMSSCGEKDYRASRYMPESYPATTMGTEPDEYVWPIRTGDRAGEADTIILPDPYQWLESVNNPDTRHWIKDQQDFYDDYASHIPYTDKVRERLERLHDYQRSQVPIQVGGRYVFTRNSGLQEQPVIFIQESLNDEPRVFFDPNTFSPHDKVSLGSYQFSHDGKFATVCLHINGSEWMKILVIEVETGNILSDDLRYVKGLAPVWRNDGFYYGSFAITDSCNVSLTTTQTVNMHVFYHKLGQMQSQDVAFVRGDESGLAGGSFEITIADDEKYLFLSRTSQERGNTLYFQDLTDPEAELQLIADDARYNYEPVGVVDGRGYVRTNYHYEQGRLLSFDVNTPGIKNWKVIVAANDNVLTDAQLADDGVILTYCDQAASRAYFYNLDGVCRHEIPVPGYGNITVSARAKDPSIFYSYSSTTYPITVFKYDQHSNTAVPFITPQVDFNSDDYVTDRVFCTSADGTKIPLFISYKKGVAFDGHTPCFLNGYGGFGINMQPRFDINRMLILEQGCIYAQVCARGGGEFGSTWHSGGMRGRKEKVFEDFIAAAEYLQAYSYTSSDRLCISGKDHGGLVTAVLANRRPDLFSVAIPRFAMLDMMRFQLYAGGWNWRYEFGTSRDSREKFDYLVKYSPIQCIHAMQDSIPYPAVLAVTGDHDETVIPCHTYKYVATLQGTRTGPEPKLAYIMPNVGHDYHGTSEEIDEFTAIYSFFLYNVGFPFK